MGDLYNEFKNIQSWHIISASESLKMLQTDKKKGLSEQDVVTRRKVFGQNSLPRKKQLSVFKLFLTQFNNILIVILILASVISFLLHERVDAYIIAAAIIINVIVGFVQEFKAQNALSKLSEVIESYCVVVRDGTQHKIRTQELVPGDVVLLTAGNNIPADCRLYDVTDLEINEASLTGESVPVVKKKTIIKNEDEVLGQRYNMAFMGTLATRGRAYAVVVATGTHTEIGKIAALLKATKSTKTPLQESLESFSRKLGGYIVVASTLVLVIGMLIGRSFTEMFTVAVAAAVSAIPEGLVIAVTVILAIGMQRILQKKALVRKLVAAETLGSTDVVCSDKTGTLTEGKMVVQSLVTAQHEMHMSDIFAGECNCPADILRMLDVGMYANNSVLENPHDVEAEWKFIGAPTAVAMLHAGILAGKSKQELLEQQPEIEDAPFNSTRKYMMSLHKLNDDQNILYFSGAPERLSAMANRVEQNGEAVAFTEKLRKKFTDVHKSYTSQGLRLVGVAYKIVDAKNKKIKNIKENELVFVGFFVIKDPVRLGVAQTIKTAQKAGIRTVMITGDHKNTAASIAQELGLHAEDGEVLTGADLVNITDDELRVHAEKVNVYARVSPHDKLRIVDAMQANKHVVAMTGDGINDAPALKSADIGIAVGAGTDVTKGVADMVLLDNNFSTIIAAIKEGRIIVDNIKKVIVYLLADSFSAMGLVLVTLFAGLPLPVTAAQILWINLISDGFPYMALTLERGEADVMKKKPRKKSESILDTEMKALIVIIGAIIVAVLFAVFVYEYKTTGNVIHARTLVFAALGLDTLFYAFSCKSLRRPLWKVNIFDNMYLIWAVFAGLGLQLFALYVPFMRTILGLDFLAFSDWLIIIPLAMVKLVIIELAKYWFIRQK